MQTTNHYELASTEQLIQNACEQKLFSGCVIGWHRFGESGIIASKTDVPTKSTLKLNFTGDTLFDIASITKSIVGLAILRYIEQNKFQLTAPINHWIQGTGLGWKKINLQHLLTNSLKLDITRPLYEMDPTAIRNVITQADVVNLGDGFHYHNSSSILLGWILETMTGKSLDKVLQELVFDQAGMSQTCFYKHVSSRESIHPSINLKIGAWPMYGMPHDELAYRFAQDKQIVGCAGVFSTASDMVKFGTYIMDGAFQNPEKMLGLMLRNWLEPFGRTSGLAFDKPANDYVCPCFARDTLVMTGFTGCAIWIQPSHRKVLTILANTTLNQNVPRVVGEKGPVSPLFEFRKAVVRKFFPCKHCQE